MSTTMPGSSSSTSSKSDKMSSTASRSVRLLLLSVPRFHSTAASPMAA
eukprot:CAMPEP_0204467410 /NCGR_PEP_ID=MMETSP0471-20130131/9797_1 /ASSEMBLY_ACC=CAM_ASM_000602 /TAXON_ID=2969 /ORGANISM="Oxyrrhis marina" /LENGTH=47 /DNA_ID= /DNA_START= /DNA_END= /DNA_ORIENTATION=